MKNTYFHRLYQHSKSLFWLVAAFCFFTLTLNFTGDEVTPFFVWGMFSEKFEPKVEQEIIEIRIDGDVFNYYTELNNVNRHMLISPIGYYHSIIENNNEDPTRSFFRSKTGSMYPKIEPFLNQVTNEPEIKEAFEAWVRRYLEHSCNKPINTLDIYLKTYRFDSQGKPSEVKAEKLFSL
ncbi:MAG: hypothetical protein AAF502_08325 [Bacteroidota bacterium]